MCLPSQNLSLKYSTLPQTNVQVFNFRKSKGINFMKSITKKDRQYVGPHIMVKFPFEEVDFQMKKRSK